MRLHACFWDYSASTRNAQIGATRRMDYSRSLLVSQAVDPMLPMAGLAGHFVSLNTHKGVQACYKSSSGKGKTLGAGPVFPLVNGFGPNEGMHRRLVLLQAYEARRGKVVQVRHGHWKDEFAGMRGTIQERWGNSEHAAVEVLLENGSSELFWLADLSEVDERVTV